VQDLPVQVGQFDRLVIHNGDVTDPGRGKVENHRRAKPARTDNQHAGRQQPFLTVLADIRHDDLTGIAFEIRIIQHRLIPPLIQIRHRRGRWHPACQRAQALPE
jgi:hypothetical protein